MESARLIRSPSQAGAAARSSLSTRARDGFEYVAGRRHPQSAKLGRSDHCQEGDSGTRSRNPSAAEAVTVVPDIRPQDALRMSRVCMEGLQQPQQSGHLFQQVRAEAGGCCLSGKHFGRNLHSTSPQVCSRTSTGTTRFHAETRRPCVRRVRSR